jgi:cobalt-zinc-cadmium efflux system outer membrane protein
VLAATLTLAALLFAPPAASEGPPRPSEDTGNEDHRHGVATIEGPSLSFDEAVGASGATPQVVGLEDAARQKSELDDGISLVPIGPQVQVMAGARVYPSDATGLELQITATQSWSLRGYGKKRREAAAAETEVLEVEALAAALEQQLAAARAWIELHAAERELALAQTELAALHELGETLERARVGGVGTRSGVADARAREAAAEQRVGDLRGRVHDLGLALARETGGDTSQPLRTSGDYPRAQLPSEEELRRAFAELESLPQVVRKRLAARAERARAAEIRARSATRLNAGASFQRESASDIVVFGVVGGNISTSHGERARGTAIAAARRAEAEAEAELLALEATLTTALHDLHHTQNQVEILGEHTLPAHTELLDSREQALELGEGTLPAVLDARARLHGVERDYAATEAEWVWARVQVWLYYQAFLQAGAGEAGA